MYALKVMQSKHNRDNSDDIKCFGEIRQHNSLTELKYSIGPGKMTQQVRVFATKPDSLSFILKIYITEGEKRPHNIVVWLGLVCYDMYPTQ